ncbi:MAG: hypothetical protein A2214_01030 [Candidatus Harrisonbacteria bacterium RIFOXYA1_FULL_48_8]|uniref:Uncharacterized protein n=2 Tax=Candidatus Harrisoniibacteriota TaxID=1817905 RepID=A0A1G1ZW99_9BACT|nr:MAG: hypothetical protein A3E64_01900 [Candidatus Harrisonbacteria bacterium RIFCSPHIGHO2_12_FULL_48_16]OGY68759.1 MAG: hypothetical protein A2214_01030 [Candidatus Harrisonbacteria bacterium RIFOXYA1_FULL_48_8]
MKHVSIGKTEEGKMTPTPEVKIAQALSDASGTVRVVDIQTRREGKLLYGVVYKRTPGSGIMRFVDKYPKENGYWPPIPDEIFRSMTDLARLAFNSQPSQKSSKPR